MLALRVLQEVPTATDEAIAELFSRVIAYWSAGLLPHFTTEGECLLARLIRHVPEDGAESQRMQRDHLHIAAFVAAMRDTASSEERRRLMLAFAEQLRAHVRWEEEQLFPLTEAACSDDELDALGADLAARLPEHPIPWDVSQPRQRH